MLLICSQDWKVSKFFHDKKIMIILDWYLINIGFFTCF